VLFTVRCNKSALGHCGRRPGKNFLTFLRAAVTGVELVTITSERKSNFVVHPHRLPAEILNRPWTFPEVQPLNRVSAQGEFR
jgi:hypothetical protein